MIPEGLGGFALLAVTSLFAIMNPLSAAPVYFALTADYTPKHRKHTLKVAVTTGAGVLVAFALLGGSIFQIFGVTLPALRIAGGVIVFGLGADMLRARQSRMKSTAEEEQEGMTREEVGIFPLGIPLIVGPGAITTVMVLMADAATLVHTAVVFGAIAAVLGSIYVVLGMGPRLIGLLGQTGLNVITRIMGLLVTVVAVQFIMDGARPVLIEVLRAAAG